MNIKSLIQIKPDGKDVTVSGWVRNKRSSKNVTFISLNDGSCIQNMQIVVEPNCFSENLLKDINTGSCISVGGKLIASKRSGQSIEILANSINL